MEWEMGLGAVVEVMGVGVDVLLLLRGGGGAD